MKSSPMKVPPGPIHPTKYQLDVDDRRDFRSRMKVELKNLAKESFLEELERIRTVQPNLHNERFGSPHDFPSTQPSYPYNNDIGRHHYVDHEVQRPQAMNVEWSNSITRDQMMMTPSFPPIASSLPNTRHGGGRGNNDFHGFHDNNLTGHHHPPPQNQHFVLSTAPIQGFEELIKQETNLFRDTMTFTKTNHPTATATPSGFGSVSQTTAAVNHNMSILEQANRYAEMQSLFQMPTSSGLPPPSSHPSLQGSSIEDYASLTHYFQATSPDHHQKYQDKQRKQQEIQYFHNKLESSIEIHRERLDKGRNPSRRFPLKVPPPSTAAASTAYKSPRLQIHHPRDFPTSTDDSTSNFHNEDGHPHINNNDEENQPTTARSSSPSRIAPQSVPHSAATMKSSSATTRTSAASVGHSRISSSQFIPHPPPPSTTATTAAIAPMESSSTSSPPRKKIPSSMTVEEFRSKTKEINDEIKKLVQDAVHQELVKDSKTQRYTKKFASSYVYSNEPPLTQRIEKSVEEKIKSLQSELTALKTTKLNKSPKRKKRGGGGGSGSHDDENDETIHPGEWFSHNALTGDNEIDMSALTKEINRSVQLIIKRHANHHHLNNNGDLSNGFGMDGGAGGGLLPTPEENGFESSSTGKNHSTQSNTSGNNNNNSNNNNATAAAATVEEYSIKPKSKIDRLLGISKDVKTGLPFNEQGPTSRRLFGSLGNILG